LQDLPKGKYPITSKWVFKTKLTTNGYVEKTKARTVACSFEQTASIDFQGMFVPTVKWATIQTVVALASRQNSLIKQLDVHSAFLNGEL
jgi:hypothetical protein